ncbi:hypothetical protein [Paraburkholderia sediminicola]|uniref:hypothetical protein n=1 Tax=Paraburkholderia sediminicola TaxID=458836 RepID=UPI0038BA87AB
MACAGGADRQDSTLSRDGAYNPPAHRKVIFYHGMTPKTPENPRGRQKKRAGAADSPFDPALFEERFRAIKRVFAAEDKFRSLLLRFNCSSDVRYALKTLAYTIINLQHHCRN